MGEDNGEGRGKKRNRSKKRGTRIQVHTNKTHGGASIATTVWMHSQRTVVPFKLPRIPETSTLDDARPNPACENDAWGL
jgi:hypothetical protein